MSSGTLARQPCATRDEAVQPVLRLWLGGLLPDGWMAVTMGCLHGLVLDPMSHLV